MPAETKSKSGWDEKKTGDDPKSSRNTQRKRNRKHKGVRETSEGKNSQENDLSKGNINMEKMETKKVVPKNAIEPSTQKPTGKTPQKQDGDTRK